MQRNPQTIPCQSAKWSLLSNLNLQIMDEMYRTVQAACKNAIRAHNKEKKMHVIFKEVGLFRIKPVEEIEAVDQKRLYGWTVPKWYTELLHPELKWEEVKRQFQMGDDCFVRKQFYKKDCHFSPKTYGIKVYNEYSHDELCDCLLNGQRL